MRIRNRGLKPAVTVRCTGHLTEWRKVWAEAGGGRVQKGGKRGQ